jgi:Zn-dependent membrane protease YugP
MVVVLIVLLILALCLGVSRHALGRYEGMLREADRERAPLAHTGAEMVRFFWAEEGVQDCEIEEHNSVISDYFDPKRRRLFLRPQIANGTSLAAWAVALHEAAHATQTGGSLGDLKWRQTVILLCRYGPVIAGFGGVALLLMRLHVRVALLMLMAACAILLLLNIGTLAIEFNANSRLRRFLDKHLDRYPSAQERLQACLSTVAIRELGDILRSPRYFFLSGLPGTGKLRPTSKS